MDKKFWQEHYFDRRNWILEHTKDLSCTTIEVFVLLMIDYLNEFSVKITPQILAEYCNLSEKEIDQIVTSLSSKAYLKLNVSKSTIDFVIDDVFTLQKEEPIQVKELFALFEEEFGRVLSQKEFIFLNNWQATYTKKMIIDALREASVLQKYSFEYIDRILIRMKKDEDDRD
jgi:DnaD and phage-associated domain